MIVPMADRGNSALVRLHGEKEVADPHVPMTWCPVWPVAAPIVSTGVIVGDDPKEHVNQGAPNVPQLTLVTVPAPPEFQEGRTLTDQEAAAVEAFENATAKELEKAGITLPEFNRYCISAG